MITEIEKSIVIPPNKRYISITPDEAQWLHDFIRSHKITKTLEIGFAYGYSAAYIMAATKTQHVAMDPYQKSHYNNVGLTYSKKLGLYKRLHFYPQFSQLVLPKLVVQKKSYEFIFADGGHKFDTTFLDFYYGDLLLLPHGYILFHDTWMPSIQYVKHWIATNRKDYRVIKQNRKNFLLLQKVAKDRRAWDHFIDFPPLVYRLKRIVGL